MPRTFNILGLESSCDDTAAAVVRQTGSEQAEIRSSVVFAQTDLHRDFGGVVPEIAARAHTEKIDICVRKAMDHAEVTFADIDAIAVTAGPGLIGGVVAGVMCAKGLSAATGIPLVGVNHLAGHALTPRMTDEIGFPYLMLLVSGGHCQFVAVHDTDRFERLGGTIDDAPGEAFDKIARLLGLPQPGGPSVEAAAETGDPARFRFPRPLINRNDCNLSFSGLKTAVLRQRDRMVDENGGLSRTDRSDICAGFQAAICDVLVSKSQRAIEQVVQSGRPPSGFAVAGGVSANQRIRSVLESACGDVDLPFFAPPLSLCTDNAAMIAYAGLQRFRRGVNDGFSLSARPRWPLDSTAPALVGSGKKGAKA